MDMLWASRVNVVALDKGKDLLLRLKARDPQAVSDLYDKYGRLVFVVILRIVNNPGVAEDLVQETYLRAWNRAPGLDEKYGSVGPWLMSIARHCALDYRKSGQAQMAAQADADEESVLAASIENQLMCSDQERILAAALQQLSPHQRTVLKLAYYEGLSQDAIAQRMGQPLGTVKSWTRTALAKLREAIDRSQIRFA
jgi:RNA polymerase sigma-70 factor (ECF subfamily)